MKLEMATRKHKKNVKSTRRKQKGGAFSVQFEGKEAAGNLRSRNQTLIQPSVQWNIKSNALYTVLMWDPDAPAASWIHWFVVNIPGATLSEGQTLLPYEPPSPPSGTHRYYVTVYQQVQELSILKPEERGNFDVARFVSRYGLRKIGEKMIRVAA